MGPAPALITAARQTSTVRRKNLIRSSLRGRRAGVRSSCSKVNRTPPERQRPRLSMARPRLSRTSARDPSRLHTRGKSAAPSPAAAETNVRQILCRASHFGDRHRHRSHGRQTWVGPGGMWPCLCRAGPRSPSPARPMTSARSQQRLTSYRRLFPDSSVMLTETISLTLDVHVRFRGRRKLALFDDSDRDSTHCGCEYGDRSGAARLSGLGNSSYRAP